jgi:flagellar biosynthesis/type III secretory pathway chaperone
MSAQLLERSPVVRLGAPSVDDLASILAEEARLYGQAIDVANEERAAVVGNSPERLFELVVEKERIAASLARAETSRQEWLFQWATKHSATIAPTLADLVRTLPNADAMRVSGPRDALLARIRDLAALNHANGQLIRSALQIVSRQIDVYQRAMGSAGYSPTGGATVQAHRTVLDRLA